MAQEAATAEDATMTDDDEMRDEHEVDDDETRENDDDSGNEEQEASANGGGDGEGGVMEVLRSQLGEHKRVLATSAAAAAATYAAKKLPDLIEHLEQDGGDKLRDKLGKASDGGGVKGFAAGAASRALSGGPGGLVDRLKQGGEDEAKQQAKDSGGVTGAAAKVADKVGGGGSKGGFGWGKGRRLPILQSIDIAAPVDTVYNQWTQFEELNSFMHRVEAVEQEEPETVVWHENIWGRRRNWKVQITEQIPNQRIEFEIKSGGQGVGVVTFHELAPKLTRIEVLFDWQPRGLVEKLGSGLRVHKRAAKTDLYRFKAFVEMRGEETGAWRGRIKDGEAQAQTRNKRNTKADPIPSEAKQHSEEDEKKARGEANGDDANGGDANGKGNDDSAAEAARDERKRHREQRAKKQKEAAA